MHKPKRDVLEAAWKATATLCGIVVTTAFLLVVAALAFDFFARTVEAHIR
jgi:hypothetical protein